MFLSYINSINSLLRSNNYESNEFKSILKLNKFIINIQTNFHGGGGDDIPKTPKEELLQFVLPIKLFLDDLTSNNPFKNATTKDKELAQTLIQFQDLLKYVNWIHSKIPTNVNVQTLHNQLNEINTIISKY